MTTIIEQLQQAKSWQQRYKILLESGKKNCAKDIRHEQNKIEGCQAKTWLDCHINSNHYEFIIDSESALIKGIGQVLCEYSNGKTAQQIHAIDWSEFLNTLGILKQLSPSRSNGIHGLIKAMLSYLPKT